MSGLLLVGGGGHCRSCIDVIEADARYAIRGVVDRQPAAVADLLGYPLLGDDAMLASLLERERNALVTVGQIKSAKARIRLYSLLKSIDAILPSIVSPYAYVSKHAGLGEGTILFHGAIVNARAFAGRNCIVNSRALVEHDAVVGDHCHVSTGAIVNGSCHIGNGTFVGSGAVVHNGVKIGSGCVIAAGAVVKNDVPDGTLMRGDR
ncbi:acetyltransferase [Rhizobium leguminosarum]|uniref:acetyltransferase n=1 Tax=Rhizobium leguminosarum TaxID=384 RepID=UPI001030BCAD|nr:acetyltransferase [Rhizobium leguminosarum]TAU87492.1 acetyltransferase [Rhizobium leguminosarum]TAV52024.1 acetyltransferase [Rhizobium leguminosarum]